MSITDRLRIALLPRLVDAEHSLVVAYSGGLDSHVLLHALVELKAQKQFANPLTAIHVHHGLSPHADDWLVHCQTSCEALNVPLQWAKVQIKAKPRHSLEAQAREARYQALLTLAPANSLVLLAQHQDDQLESVLLQLKRGSGPKGLAGMAEHSSQQLAGKIVNFLRPLLDVTRQHIHDYAQQHGLRWVEDESNHNHQFERNFLRHEVIPVLTKKWPSLGQTVRRSASLCAEQQTLLEQVSAEKLEAVRASHHTLHIDALKKLSAEWVQQVVRYWLAELGISSPAHSVLTRLYAELINARVDANPIIQWQGWQFRRFDKQLYVIPLVEDVLPHTLLWQGQKELVLPATLGTLVFKPPLSDEQHNVPVFQPDLGPLRLHFGQFSQRFKPYNAQHSKPLKQWYKAWEIPPWQRDKITVVSQNAEPLALLIEGAWVLAQPKTMPSNSNKQPSLMAIHHR